MSSEDTVTAVSYRSQRINAAYQFIQDHLDTHFTLQELSEAIGCSRFHLNREFANHTGLNLQEFVQRRRLLRAEKLLRVGRYSVIDVALMVGYQSHSSFSRAFRNLFGFAPSKLDDIPQGDKPPPELAPPPVSASLVLRDQHLLLGLWGSGYSNHSFAQTAGALFGQLLPAIQSQGLPIPPLLFGLSKDNPLDVEGAQAAFFAGIEITNNAVAEQSSAPPVENFCREKFPAGLYLFYQHAGPLNSLWQAISQLYNGYLYPAHLATPGFRLFYQFHVSKADKAVTSVDVFIPLSKDLV